MFTELLAAAKAIPRIVDALERLGDLGTAIAAQQRKDEKDKVLIDLIATARERRLRQREAERLSGDSGSSSEGLGDGGGI
ncbi:MAG: hypothetical protein Unbinned3138contig1002_32 [Prokaryotic dsDNA virus sp.]|jgi:hypothetical protein|nr:MAG: hypothetical protein Unbinned3138contig1002_32 [Prokaryotic dsDNA virus sp.]|tara:strand:+ start:3160 stop:3399 length:240 start_codon:yes stop_codon:yes gene_type:complete